MLEVNRLYPVVAGISWGERDFGSWTVQPDLPGQGLTGCEKGQGAGAVSPEWCLKPLPDGMPSGFGCRITWLSLFMT